MYKCTKRNKKWKNQVSFNEKGNCACDKGEKNNDLKLYASMARMSGIDKCHSGNFGESFQLTNRILDFGPTCHMKPQVSDFIIGSLGETDKYIEVSDGHHVTAKKRDNRREACYKIRDRIKQGQLE